MHYLIKRAVSPPSLNGDADSSIWQAAQVAQVSAFHPASSNHRPATDARVLYDDSGLYVSFRTKDRYVISRRSEHQTLTSRDSCVELCLQPSSDGPGYFNFEMNCGGALLLFWVSDPTRVQQGVFKRKEVLPKSLIETMRIYHSMSRLIESEISDSVTWAVEYFISNAMLESYAGALGPPAQRKWRGNFFKCADDSSHPHWASWNPIGDELNFHVPAHFAPFEFQT